jgi:hypothetical protein
MKPFIITLCLVLLATCALAQKTVTVWNNGKATIYQIYPNGQVVGSTPGRGGLITGNINDGNLYDNRIPTPGPDPSLSPGQINPYIGGSPYVGGSYYLK